VCHRKALSSTFFQKNIFAQNDPISVPSMTHFVRGAIDGITSKTVVTKKIIIYLYIFGKSLFLKLFLINH